MKIVSFFSSKGGVGKTTLLCNLASYLVKFSNKKVLVIDGDPQSNASMYLLDEHSVNEFYYNESESLSWYLGEAAKNNGIGKNRPRIFRSENFELDVMPGHPSFEMLGDTFVKEKKLSDASVGAGLSISFLIKELLAGFSRRYDFVFVDMGPSSGLLNKNLVLASDFFLSPISVDSFGAVAIKNISFLLNAWRDELLDSNYEGGSEDFTLDLDERDEFNLKFVGYVIPKYHSKYSRGGRSNSGYDDILQQLHPYLSSLEAEFGVGDLESANLGFIPNLTSLMSLSQVMHKPVFDLGANDGVSGAQFAAVDDAKTMYSSIAKNFLNRISIESKDGN